MTRPPDPALFHRESLRRLGEPGQALAVDSPRASTANPAWFSRAGGVLRARPQRRRVHRQIISEFEGRAPGVRRGRQAIVMAGPPGAGKTSALNEVVRARGGRADEWRVVNSDDFKDDLLRQALRDGSYDTWFRPHELAEGPERFYPRELAALVHEESGELADMALDRSLRRGDNVVVDGTLSSEPYARVLVDRLAQTGYDVQVVDVEAPREIVQARVEARWRHGFESAQGQEEQGPDRHPGGRWVPEVVVDRLFPHETAPTSASELVARTISEQHPAVSQYRLYRVDGPAAAPRLASEGSRVDGALVLTETSRPAPDAHTVRDRAPGWAASTTPGQAPPTTGPTEARHRGPHR